MSLGPELKRLARLWAAQPGSTYFAPLADALRKQGSLEQATVVATAGVATRPDFLPGRVVMARIYRDQGQHEAALSELRAALAIDASNPVALEDMALLAPTSRAADNREPAVANIEEIIAETDAECVFDEARFSDAEMAEAEPLLTESLAMVYRRQGHLEQAVGVLDALAARAPDDVELAARRDALRAEFNQSRPRPYDASRSGGVPVRDWLSHLASSGAGAPVATSGFDAFFEPAAPSPSEAGDLEAFQAWLRDLDR